MGFKCGIVGLPNVGKSTLFNALTSSKNAQAANFPFCTIDPNIGIVDVPDERLKILSSLSNTKKDINANITFVDIAGLVKGASKGEGLGNKFLSHIREVDAIIHLVRCFESDKITHVNSKINPVGTSFIISLIQKILVFISFFFHGKLYNFFLTRLGLSKYKRLTLTFEDRERILNFCLSELEKIGKNSNKKINILFFPGFFLNENLKKTDEIDRKILNKYPKSSLLKVFMMKNLELKFKKYATPQKKKIIYHQDNNHPNKFGSKITAEEIVKILKTSKN